MLEINKFNKIIAANWKLNGSLEFTSEYSNFLNSVEIMQGICGIICPPSIYIRDLKLKSDSLYLGAQNCSNYDSGAFTGEISSAMLADSNCQFCIVGHSERRQVFAESNEICKLKAEKLIKHNINPIICIGETLDEKKKGLTKDTLTRQIINSMPDNSSIKHVIIAYEPIWAIGSGLTPSLEEIENIHKFLKNDIKNYENYKIIYGGSVKSDNAKKIMNLDNVDGVLVGGASLNSIEFTQILNALN